MRSIYLTLLLLLPSSLADVNCRTACQYCHQDNQLTELLDIYCSMCHECNQRTKDRLRMKLLRPQKTELFKKEPEESPDSYLEHYDNDVEQLREGDYSSEQGIFADRRSRTIYLVEETTPTTPFNIANCPTGEPCSDADEEEPTTTTATTTTTTTTTTIMTTPAQTCPPIKVCKKKKKTTTPSLPSPPPCMPYVCPMYLAAPFPGYPPFPPPPPYPPPPPPPINQQSSVTPTHNSTEEQKPSNDTVTTTTQSSDGAHKQEFLLMYLGVPKGKGRRTFNM